MVKWGHELNYIIIHSLYTRHYMDQIAFYFNFSPLPSINEQPVYALEQIRDNLLFSLISQLHYNRILLGNLQAQDGLWANLEPKKLAVESRIQDTNESYHRRTLFPRSSHRKIIRHARHSKMRLSSMKNDTKNIPKNYGKAILTHILKSPEAVKVTAMFGLSLPQFLIEIRKMKNKINSIEGLRKMWGSDGLNNAFKKCTRILSYQFMRKHCLRYIFYSKVRNFGTHIKYRQKLIEGIENPLEFSHIKEY